MILLVSSCSQAQACAAAIEKAAHEATKVCSTLAEASSRLRSATCSVLVLDGNLAEADSQAADTVLEKADTATAVVVNLAICGMDRLVREVRAAQRRHERERLHALREAEENLRHSLTESLTGILLSSQLALKVPELPPAAQARLQSVYQLAMDMRQRLQSTG
jgi:hypothetical protein